MQKLRVLAGVVVIGLATGCAPQAIEYTPPPIEVPPSIFELSESLVIGKTTRSEAIALLGSYNSEAVLADGTTLLQWMTIRGRSGETVGVTFDRDGVMKALASRSRNTF